MTPELIKELTLGDHTIMVVDQVTQEAENKWRYRQCHAVPAQLNPWDIQFERAYTKHVRGWTLIAIRLAHFGMLDKSVIANVLSGQRPLFYLEIPG